MFVDVLARDTPTIHDGECTIDLFSQELWQCEVCVGRGVTVAGQPRALDEEVGRNGEKHSQTGNRRGFKLASP